MNNGLATPPPDENAISVNPHKCYTARVPAGTPKFSKGMQVVVADRFNAPPKLFDLCKPRRFFSRGTSGAESS